MTEKLLWSYGRRFSSNKIVIKNKINNNRNNRC